MPREWVQEDNVEDKLSVSRLLAVWPSGCLQCLIYTWQRGEAMSWRDAEGERCQWGLCAYPSLGVARVQRSGWAVGLVILLNPPARRAGTLPGWR